MTLVAIPKFALYMAEYGFVTQTSAAVGSSGHATSAVFQAPKTGTIDRAGFRVAAATTTGNATVSLQTVDASGNPSGTLWGTNTSVVTNVLNSADDTWIEVTLTAGASVTRGDILALVVTADATLNINVVHGLRLDVGGFPYIDTYTGSWAKSTGRVFAGAIRYSDTEWTYATGMMPVASATTSFGSGTFNNGSTPDERGNKLTVPFACKVAGIWHRVAAATTGDYDLKLYDSGGSVLGSCSVDGDLNQIANAYNWFPFASEVTLAAGDVVRATKLPTSATNVQYADTVFPSGRASAAPMGTWAEHTHRTDAGSWTDTADKHAHLGLVVSAVDDGASAGGGPRAMAFAS